MVGGRIAPPEVATVMPIALFGDDNEAFKSEKLQASKEYQQAMGITPIATGVLGLFVLAKPSALLTLLPHKAHTPKQPLCFMTNLFGVKLGMPTGWYFICLSFFFQT
jgi:hypothetical protein